MAPPVEDHVIVNVVSVISFWESAGYICDEHIALRDVTFLGFVNHLAPRPAACLETVVLI